MTTPNTYPFDPTGLSTTNLVTDENHALTVPDREDFFFVIPKAAPFFRESMIVKRFIDDQILVEGVDYTCTHLFYAATKQTGKPVYGSLTFYDRSLTAVSITYQTVGGEWTISDDEIVEILTRKQVNPRLATWEQVTNVPCHFPPIDHEFNIEDFIGAKDVVKALNKLEIALLSADNGDIGPHIADKSNPHDTNKVQVGLGFVENYPPATLLEARAGVANDRYMTPAGTKAAIEALVGTAIGSDISDMQSELSRLAQSLRDHIQDKNNPHDTTKDHVGLNLVENYPPATVDEAEMGVAEDRYLTPKTGRAMIELHMGNLDLSTKLDTVVFETFLDELIDIIVDNTIVE